MIYYLARVVFAFFLWKNADRSGFFQAKSAKIKDFARKITSDFLDTFFFVVRGNRSINGPIFRGQISTKIWTASGAGWGQISAELRFGLHLSPTGSNEEIFSNLENILTQDLESGK